MIELIRQGQIAEALQFAQDELAPRGEESPEFLAELERTMALLAFDPTSLAPSAITDLLSPAQRMKTAGEVNAAILESFSQSKEVKLVQLLRLLCWGESMLGERADFPKVRMTGRGAHDVLREPAGGYIWRIVTDWEEGRGSDARVIMAQDIVQVELCFDVVLSAWNHVMPRSVHAALDGSTRHWGGH